MTDMIQHFRATLVVLSIVLWGNTNAQLQPGFDPAEARDMAALCTSFTFQDLYGSDTDIIPAGYQRIYTSVPSGLDNKFDVFKKDDRAIIVFRGSTAAPMSWMENMYAAMIPAKGELQVAGKEYEFDLADDTSASIHSGYTLGLLTMSEAMLEQLDELHDADLHDVIITGHSQGGALAILARAYLERLPRKQLPRGMRFKTYAFANPMVGNKAFSAEYEKEYCTTLSSFSIINPEDPFPGMPVSYEEGSAFSMQSIMGMLFGGTDIKATALNAMIRMFGGTIEGMAQFTSTSVEKRVEGVLGEIQLPPYRDEMNYSPTPTRIMLESFSYPLILQDPSILQNDSIMQAEQRDSNGVFLNKALYRKAPGMFQHKPYNYYVALLERYFPEDHERLEVKILPENL